MADIRRQKAIIAVGVILLGIFAFTVQSWAGSQDAPKFFVRDKTADLGEFYEGKDINYEFRIRNNGVGELHITNVKPG